MHSWAEAGVYTISVSATDNESTSGATAMTIMIDAMEVGDLGYFTDDDADGTYDTFHGDVDTPLTMDDDGNYMIDTDGDEEPDWVYNPVTEELTEYEAEPVSYTHLRAHET